MNYWDAINNIAMLNSHNLHYDCYSNSNYVQKCFTKKVQKMETIIKILKWIVDILVRSKKEPELISQESKKLLWYPGAIIKDFGVITRGTYLNAYPEGAIVHYTAGRNSTWYDAITSGAWLGKQGNGAFVIANDGRVIQSFPLDKWAYHAGVSYHDLVGKSVSSKLVGIEVCCGGLLTEKNGKFYTWFDKEVMEENRVYSTNALTPGWYEKFTPEQEKALWDLLLWLKENNPDIFSLDKVLGHECVAIPKGRKQDPGGSIEYPMPIYRKMLNVEYSNRASIKKT